MEPAEGDEFGDRFLAQAFDVQRAARNEVPQPCEALRRANEPAGAANVDLAFLGDGLGIAHRAADRELVSRARFVAGEVLDDLRNHVAGTLDTHAVTDSQAEPND